MLFPKRGTTLPDGYLVVLLGMRECHPPALVRPRLGCCAQKGWGRIPVLLCVHHYLLYGITQQFIDINDNFLSGVGVLLLLYQDANVIYEIVEWCF